MAQETDSTESLLDRTKRLLDARGSTSLREIAEGAEVSVDWLRSISCGRATNPGIQLLEKLYAYLVEFHAAKRFAAKRIASAADSPR